MLLRSIPLLLLLSACSGPKITDLTGGNGPPLDLRVEYTALEEAEALFGKRAAFEVLIDGMGWAEGPVVLSDGSVLVSDVEQNRIMGWNGKQPYVALDESGGVDDGYSKEPGSNGLAVDAFGDIAICRHGSRDVVVAGDLAGLREGRSVIIADNYRGKRFNSPNDLVIAANGATLFTDPPYGLPKNERNLKELDFQGVYQVRRDSVHLLTAAYTRPNGIGLSPNEKTLYLANSDPKHAVVTATDLNWPVDPEAPVTLGKTRVLLDATHLAGKEPGLPDGLCVARNGRIFATAPGGVWVLEPDGRVIAKVRTGLPVANVTLDPAEEWLYLASDFYLIRTKITPENAPTERPGN